MMLKPILYSILPQHVIFLQAREQLKPHMNSRVIQSEGDMEDIYTLIPFPDKERSFLFTSTSSNFS